jgi:hypothetical protein
MTTIAKIRIRETQGMRRFLYPLSTVLPLPENCRISELGLLPPNSQALPLQVREEGSGGDTLARLDFAVSLAPQEALELELRTGMPPATLEDPLSVAAGERYRSDQLRFSLEFDRMGHIHQAWYDGESHLRSAVRILRNGGQPGASGEAAFAAGSLAAHLTSPGNYPDGAVSRTVLEITACKSWAVLTHVLLNPRAGDQVLITLPLAVNGPRLTYDVGAGGGRYGVLQPGSPSEVVWQSEFRSEGNVSWSLRTDGRTDYQGEEESGGRYRSRRWFHLVDQAKSIAVAVTSIPKDCRSLTVTLRASGECDVSFQLGDAITGPAAFGICSHFLNDVPAVAAATNPQSILLPPLVEVLPASE